MNMITSNDNLLVKEVKRLKDRKRRESEDVYFIEGSRFVQEALNENVYIERVIFSEQFLNKEEGKEMHRKILEKHFQINYVSDKVFKTLTDTKSPQGILAIIKNIKYEINDLIKYENNFILFLDSIQDPGNMGTIIRTADASGVTLIILSKGCVDVHNPKVLRSTMGSIFRIPICIIEDRTYAIEHLKGRGIKIYASHIDGKLDLFNANLRGNIALVIGNEANGVCDEIVNRADMCVKIPMVGKVESLNVAVAAGLLMYEVLRYK